MRSAVLGLCLLAAACGKVGEPLPPFIRIPEAVKDLNVSQTGNNIVLTWTNPAQNIDGSAATNLAHVRIQKGGTVIATVNVTEPGKVQSYSIPINPPAESAQTFAVTVDTKQDKSSIRSNQVTITPVEVPGGITDLHATVDQRKITLTWGKPQKHPELADAYIVMRTDRPTDAQVVSETRYDDSQYQPGKTFTYQVTAIRRIADRTVPGIEPESISVLVEDKVPPQAPAGLDIVESDNTAYLTWDANAETDLAGYHVFRSESPDGPFSLLVPMILMTNQFVDKDYKKGLYYAVSAIDEFGNESPRSPAFRAP